MHGVSGTRGSVKKRIKKKKKKVIVGGTFFMRSSNRLLVHLDKVKRTCSLCAAVSSAKQADK